jgi:hypothetical protein
MAVAAGVVVLIAAIIAGVIALVGGSSPSSAVTLEPAAQAGVDPFTASVAIGPAADFPGKVRAIAANTRKAFSTDPRTHTLIATATTPGLYGGSGDVQVCKPQQVVTYLEQNPQKAAAWAGVLGIAPSGIAGYVGSLTPVLLTSDTLVTNHGYRDGHATTLQSVLEAGTAVMIDATGTPRVKCNCGNPLTPPELIAPTHTRGTAWPGYTPTQVTVVRSGPATTTITLINTTTGETYPQPTGDTGATGASTGEFVAITEGSTPTNTALATSADGTAWKTVMTLNEPVHGLAWGDGKWLAVSSSGDPSRPSLVLESKDLSAWHQVGTIPSVVNDVAFAAGRWIAVGGVVTETGEMASEFPKGAVYSSADGRSWNRIAVVNRAPEFTSVAFGNGTWVASADDVHQGGVPSFVFVSKDATHWTSNGMLNGQNHGQLAFGAGRWVLGGTQLSGEGGTISLSRDATTWTQQATFANNRITGVAYGAGRWIAVGPDGSFGTSPSTSTAFASSDGKTWSKRGQLENTAVYLAFGGSAASASSSTTTTPATSVGGTTQASSLTNVDWKNFTYDDQACPTRGPITLTNGKWYEPGTKGQISECSMSFVGVKYADVTGDGVDDAIVSLHGSASPVLQGQSDWTTVFTVGAGGPVNRGYVYGPSFPPYSASGFTVWIPHSVGLDPDCCPSQYEKDAYTYASSSGTFTKTGVTTVPASEFPGR